MVEPTPPTIVVMTNANIPPEHVNDVLLGIEEEGMPHELSHGDSINPLVLAHQAANRSRLGIGIGIALDYIVVTTPQLPEGRPYLATLCTRGDAIRRAAGANAARLVKRVPLLALT